MKLKRFVPLFMLGAMTANAGELEYKPRDSWDISRNPLFWSEQVSLIGNDVRNGREISEQGALSFETGAIYKNHLFLNNDITYNTGQRQITQIGMHGGLIGQAGNLVGSAG